MKKIIFYLTSACVLLTFNPVQSYANITETTSSSVIPKSEKTAEAKILLLRLNEINAMDKSNLKSSDKRNLRREVRSIKQQLKELSGGVYISAGAVIIILLLLIILL